MATALDGVSTMYVFPALSKHTFAALLKLAAVPLP